MTATINRLEVGTGVSLLPIRLQWRWPRVHGLSAGHLQLTHRRYERWMYVAQLDQRFVLARQKAEKLRLRPERTATEDHCDEATEQNAQSEQEQQNENRRIYRVGRTGRRDEAADAPQKESEREEREERSKDHQRPLCGCAGARERASRETGELDTVRA